MVVWPSRVIQEAEQGKLRFSNFCREQSSRRQSPGIGHIAAYQYYTEGCLYRIRYAVESDTLDTYRRSMQQKT